RSVPEPAVGLFSPMHHGCCSYYLNSRAGINQLSPHHRYGNIGYWVRQSRQGQGIARQAVALLRDFGFQQLGLFRLEIVMGVGNSASEAVAIAVGATFECRARNRIFLHGRPLDALIYSLVPAG
ncbi:GNAT family N-acetyltransferase, partial [Aeromonas sp. QDB39]